MPDQAHIEAEVLEAFHAFMDTYARREAEALEQILALTAPGFMGFGTGRDEVGEDLEAYRRLLERDLREVPCAISIAYPRPLVRVLGAGAGVVAAELELTVPTDGDPLVVYGRMTIVFVRREGRWLQVHQHISRPASDQAPGESFPIDALRARNRELEHLVDERTAALETARREAEAALEHLKAAQAQLIQAEKMASLGEMTAGIAHEIKNPLNFINNFAELNAELADELFDELAHDPDIRLADMQDVLDDLKRNAEKINEHGKRADSIVRAMMQHARGGAGKRERVDINTFVEEYLGLAYHGTRATTPDFNAELVQHFDPEAGAVELVPQELGRVLLNLLSNAFYAVHECARAANGAYEPTVTVSTRGGGERIEIRISDNGGGIPQEDRERIFEPFFTTKPTGSGTGLGLSLSYDIVTNGHGGTLALEDDGGEGATFVITLPVSTGPPR